MARYGTGPTHAQKPQVERLIEFQVTPAGILLTETLLGFVPAP